MIFVTVCCTNYVPQAIFMARSVRNWHDAEALVLCLLERELPECPELDVFDLVIRASELPFEDFDRLIFKYLAPRSRDGN